MINFSILQFLEYASIIGTNIFFMITGYFLVKPRTISYAISKSLNTWKVVMLYSVGIYAILSLTGAIDFQPKQLVAQLFPIHSHNYWFMSNYIVLVLLSPFTSKLLYSLSKREYQVLLLVVFCINFGEHGIGYGNIFSGNMSLIFDMALFAWGGYLKRFPFKEFKGDYLLYFALYIAICVALTCNSYALQFLSSNPSASAMHIRSMSNNSLPLFTATLFFLASTSHKLRIPVFIGNIAISISPYILAVYLIHDNPFAMPIMWLDIVKPDNYINSYWMIPYCIAIVISIFAACILVEYIRQHIEKAIKLAAQSITKLFAK